MHPYTVRDIVTGRLGLCDRVHTLSDANAYAIKTLLRYYLPPKEEIGNISRINSPAKLYVIGIGLLSKLVTLDDVRGDILSTYSMYEIYVTIEDSGILEEML